MLILTELHQANMKTKIVEVCQPELRNWGKFMVAQFDEAETSHISAVTHSPFLVEVGYGGDIRRWLWVFDLQTGEGAIFPVLNRGSVRHDLDKHKIWVCLLYEPFIGWLYQNYDGDIDKIPNYLEINAPDGLYGYRRPGLGELTAGLLDDVALRKAAQTILDVSIRFALVERNKNIALPLGILWESIRQEVALSCRELVEAGTIANYNLQEITDNIAGWEAIGEGTGKVFVLWLTANGITVGSDQTSVTAQI
jgi:hypothetical protein